MRTTRAKPTVEIQPYRVTADAPPHPHKRWVVFPRIFNYYRANDAAKRLGARLRRKGYQCRVHGCALLVYDAPDDVIQRA